MYKCKSESRSRSHCHRGKATSISFYECLYVALVIQHTKRMRRIVLSSVPCLTWPAENKQLLYYSKVLVYFCQILMELELSRQIFEK